MKIDIEQLKGLTNSLDMPIESIVEPIEEALLIAYLRSLHIIAEEIGRAHV